METNPHSSPAVEQKAPPAGEHRNLGWSLLVATLGTVVVTSLACIAAATLALNRITTNIGEDSFYGVASGVIGAFPVAIVTCCSKESYRLAVAFIGSLLWAFLTGACYYYLVFGIASC